jgi:hypothetical protein
VRVRAAEVNVTVGVPLMRQFVPLTEAARPEGKPGRLHAVSVLPEPPVVPTSCEKARFCTPLPRVKAFTVMREKMVREEDPLPVFVFASVTVMVTLCGPNTAVAGPETTQFEPLAATLRPPGLALGAVKAHE